MTRPDVRFVLVALALAALTACSASGPADRDVDVATPLDWAIDEPAERAAEVPDTAGPEALAEPNVPDSPPDSPPDVATPDIDTRDDPEPFEVDSVEPLSPDIPDVPGEAAPELVEAVEPDTVEAVEIVDVLPESDGTPCVAASDCEGLPHPPCPGWWTCDPGCAWSCPAPLDLYDLGDLEDDQQLFAEVLAETDQTFEGHGFRVQEVLYRSFEWVSGAKTVISIHGFLAHPQWGDPVKPGVVLLTGLEEIASPGQAMELAGRVDAVVLALDGPGQGGSLGHGPSSDLGLLFATEPDARATWFYAYAVAASRGLTWLKGYPAVKPALLGVVGRRLGGVTALLVNGVDRRVRAAVALEAAGDIPTAARQEGWFKQLLAAASLAPYSAAVDLWASHADPLAYAAFQRGPVLMAIGAQDEYHPLTTTLTTYAAIAGADKRLALIANWDAAWYAGTSGKYTTFDNGTKATRVLRDATTAWLRHHLAADAAYPIPDSPTVAREADGAGTRFHASCAAGADGATARVYFSGDAAYTFQGLSLEATGPDSWSASTTELLPSAMNDSNLVYFSEISVPVGAPGGDEVLTVTSVAHTYPTFVPVVRPKL